MLWASVDVVAAENQREETCWLKKKTNKMRCQTWPDWLVSLSCSCVFPDNQTEDWQQPIRQRFPGLLAADGHGEVHGILGPALFVYLSPHRCG